MKTCKDCPSTNLPLRGKNGTRTRCLKCSAAKQRREWAANRDKKLEASRRNYAKHAEKRRAESAAYKADHREYYALAEWFRRKGIPIRHIDPADIASLVEMKKAVKGAKPNTLTPSRGGFPGTTTPPP